MNIKHMIILIVILVGSDLLIGFYGHYTGSTDDEISVPSFFNYITNQDNLNELLVVFIVAIFIVAILHFVLKVG